MNFDYEVFDDLLPKEDENRIESISVTTFVWGYVPNITLGNNNDNQRVDKFLRPEQYNREKDLVGFSSDVLKSLDPNIFNSLINKSCDKIEYKCKGIYRGQSFLMIPQRSEPAQSIVHLNRIDEHLVLLYYVNDCDGDTVLFDDDGKEKARISPKRGRVLLFDGSIKHCASSPSNAHRCVITFDLFGEFTKSPKNDIMLKPKKNYN